MPTPPELIDTGTGGDTLRQLVVPRLFVAQPNGEWNASIAQPGTDRATRDGMTASFRFRTGARWSDGTAITVDDLRRTMDVRFVSSVDAPDSKGFIKVHLKQKLPNWRMA